MYTSVDKAEQILMMLVEGCSVIWCAHSCVRTLLCCRCRVANSF
jgi:hypothetical protein